MATSTPLFCITCQQQIEPKSARAIVLNDGRPGYGCPLDATPLVALALADDVGKSGPVRVDEELKK